MIQKDDNSSQKKKLEKYIQDVAYQFLVLSEAYPEMNIRCSLLMPDKAKRTSIDGMAGWFSIEKDEKVDDVENEELPAQNRPGFRKPLVRFHYEHHPERETRISQLIKEGILSYRDVTDDVLHIQDQIRITASKFIGILNNDSAEGTYCLTKNCKTCEFRTPNETLNGFNECWGEMAIAEPHIFDLYYGGAIGSLKKGYYLDELIDNGKACLFDVETDRLKNAKGEYGSRGTRQLIQLEYTRNNLEWRSDELREYCRKISISASFC